MKILKVAVVGVGHMGEYHARAYTEIPFVKLVKVVDILPERAEKISQQYNTDFCTNYRDLIEKEEVDAVSIAVPTELHYQIAKEFLNAGIHTLIEKPMTTDISQAKELIQKAKEKNLVLHVGHVERFNAAVQEIKNIVKDPILIESRRLGPFNTRTNDTGVILDLVIHDVDIILNLVNSKIKALNVIGQSVYTKHEDVASVQIMFENGCLANIIASRVTDDKIRTLTITQKDAYISLDYADQDLRIHRRASSKYIVTKEIMRYKQESFIERIFVHKDNPLKLELMHFAKCVLNDDYSKTASFETDLQSLQVCLEILDQLKNNQKLKNPI